MTQRKTPKTKPPNYSDLVLLAAGLAQTSALLHQVCDSLFSLGEKMRLRWDKDRQAWVGIDK